MTTTISTETAAVVSEVRLLVLGIRDLYRELPDTIASIAGLHAVTYSAIGSPSTGGVKVLGGDASVMHGAGTISNVTSSRAGNREHAQDNLPTDPPSVLAVLSSIEDTWRHELDDPAADKTSIDASVAYLIANVIRSVQFIDLSADIAELTTLHCRLLAVTGHTNQPKASDAPCDTCNGRIVQQYGDDGLEDDLTCSTCGKTYTPTQYARATKSRLESVRTEDRLVTAYEARTIWGLSEDQVYNWERGADESHPFRTPKIVAHSKDLNGRKLYRNTDIAALKQVA